MLPFSPASESSIGEDQPNKFILQRYRIVLRKNAVDNKLFFSQILMEQRYLITKENNNLALRMPLLVNAANVAGIQFTSLVEAVQQIQNLSKFKNLKWK